MKHLSGLIVTALLTLAVAHLTQAASVKPGDLFAPDSASAEAPPNQYAANSRAIPGHCGATIPPPGTIIDAHNVSSCDCYLPAAAIEVVKHGFRIRIAGTHNLEWPKGFKDATEKYSPQVRLDEEGNLTNYIAGMPFPLVSVEDPKAARKIAYNWHLGPFMPDDFSQTEWGSYGYSDSGVTSKPVFSEPDYTYVCEQFDFLRYAHRTEIDPRPTFGAGTQKLEWKARCNNWNQESEIYGGQSVWMRFLDPRHFDESYTYDPSSRRLRRNVVPPPYVNHECRGCHQPYWAYALPKTEAYNYRLLGTTPILGCMTADDEPAGFVGRDPKAPATDMLANSERMTMGEEPYEMRSAYIVEMIPTDSGYNNLRALIWIDNETYVWLGAEFFEYDPKTERPELQEIAAPLWRTHPAPEGGNLFDLAGSFYVPLSYQPHLHAHPELAGFRQQDLKNWFFRSVVPAHGPLNQKIDTGISDDSIFNPLTLGH
jgi:hypothetical protein